MEAHNRSGHGLTDEICSDRFVQGWRASSLNWSSIECVFFLEELRFFCVGDDLEYEGRCPGNWEAMQLLYIAQVPKLRPLELCTGAIHGTNHARGRYTIVMMNKGRNLQSESSGRCHGAFTAVKTSEDSLCG